MESYKMQDPSTAFQTLNPPPPQFPEQEQLKCPRCDSPNTKFCYYNNYNLSQPRHFCKNCRRYWTKGGSLRNIPVGGGTRKTTKRSSTKRANPDPDPSQDSTRPAHRHPQPSSSSSPPPPPPPQPTSAARSIGIGNSGLASQSGQGVTRLYGMELELELDRKILDMGGSFSTLLTSSGQFGNMFEGLSSNGSGLKMVQMGGFGEDLNSGLNASSGRGDQGLDGQTAGSGGNSNNGSGGSEGYLQLQSGDWANNNGWPDLAIYTPGSGFQ